MKVFKIPAFPYQITKERTTRIEGIVKARSDRVRIAFLPGNEYFEKNDAKGIAIATDTRRK